MGHHYVPQFLLRGWSTAGRFVAYYWEDRAGKVVVNRKATAKSACQITNLNTFFGVGVPPDKRDAPERDYFTPIVDTPAADALRVVLRDGVRALTPTQRIDWARLLVSFGVRTPDTLRQMGPRETRRAFDLVESAAKGPPEAEKKVTELIQGMMPTLERNLPLQIAMDLCSDPDKLGRVASMKWWLRRWDRNALLIGDRPLLTYPRMSFACGIPLDNPSCLITLPVTPKVLFLASADPKIQAKMRRMALGKLAKIVNEEMIFQSNCVYFSNDSITDFITPRLAGKARNGWRPS